MGAPIIGFPSLVMPRPCSRPIPRGRSLCAALLGRAAAALSLTLALACGDARADDDPVKGAQAQELFDEATRLMREGRAREACPKLEESIELAPGALGGKLKLAECYEQAGRLASAWATYLQVETAARRAGQTDRETWASARAAELRSKLSRLQIVVPEPLRELKGLVVRRDGEVVGPGQWGMALPVDGGMHEVRAEAPGRAPFSATPYLEPAGDVVSLEVRLPAPSPQGEPDLPARGPTIPAWVWGVGAAGLAVAAVGVAFRVDGASVEDAQARACGPARDACPPSFDVAGSNTHKERSFGLFVGLVAGGGALVITSSVSAIVYASQPSAKARKPPPVSAAPWVLERAGGLLVQGRF